MRRQVSRKFGAAMTVAAAAAGLSLAVSASPANAADTDLRVTEVSARGNDTPFGDDWIEVTNTGPDVLDLAGWTVNDNNGGTGTARAIQGLTPLDPGEAAIVLMESPSSGVALFADQWFGGTLPAGLQVGWADGSGLGLGNGGDAVNVWNDSTTLVASVTFGSVPSGSPIPTLDNAAGLNFTTIATPSQSGVNGAFASSNGAELGSPGIATLGGGPLPGPTFDPWPGSPNVVPAENFAFGEDMSGLDYEPSGTSAHGVLWAARNKAGTLFRLLHDGTNWVPDSANGWAAGKDLQYPGGVGQPDSEGVTFAGDSSAGGIYIAAERDNDNSGVSRNSVLRYDVSTAGTPLAAAQEWNLTALLPATGANLGLEAITWIDDAHLVAGGVVDDSTGAAYDPADYPNHGAGLFLVSLEQTGDIYVLALATTGEAALITTFESDLPVVTDLQYDREERKLWAECDNSCAGRLTVFELDATGDFVATGHFERPANLADNNNEGFAIAPNALCVDGFKPVYWSDDSETGGVSILEGLLSCTGAPDPVVPEFPMAVLGLLSGGALLGGWFVLRRRSATAAA